MASIINIKEGTLFSPYNKKNEYFMHLMGDITLEEKVKIITKYIKDFNFNNYYILLTDYFDAFSHLFFIKCHSETKYLKLDKEKFLNSFYSNSTNTISRLKGFANITEQLLKICLKILQVEDTSRIDYLIDVYAQKYPRISTALVDYHKNKNKPKPKSEIYSKGDVVFVEGEIFDQILILKKGKIGLYKVYEDRVIKICDLEKGFNIGVLSNILGHESIFTGIAEEDSEFILFPVSSIKIIVEKQSNFILDIFNFLSRTFLLTYYFIYINEIDDPVEKLVTFFTYKSFVKKHNAMYSKIRLYNINTNDVIKALNMNETDKKAFIQLFQKKILSDHESGLEIYSYYSMIAYNEEIKKAKQFNAYFDDEEENSFFKDTVIIAMEKILRYLKENPGLDYSMLLEFYKTLKKESKTIKKNDDGEVILKRISPAILFNYFFSDAKDKNLTLPVIDYEALLYAFRIFYMSYNKVKKQVRDDSFNDLMKIEYENSIDKERSESLVIANAYKDISKIHIWFDMF